MSEGEKKYMGGVGTIAPGQLLETGWIDTATNANWEHSAGTTCDEPQIYHHVVKYISNKNKKEGVDIMYLYQVCGC